MMRSLWPARTHDYDDDCFHLGSGRYDGGLEKVSGASAQAVAGPAYEVLRTFEQSSPDPSHRWANGPANGFQCHTMQSLLFRCSQS